MEEFSRNVYTTPEVAELLRVDPITIKRWRESGKIPFVRSNSGWQYFYPVDAINAMIDDHETERK
jgi:excisionase family DNA binding protein